MMRCGEVFDRQAQRFEQRDILRRCSAGSAVNKNLAEFAENVIVVNNTFSFGDEEVAGLVPRRFPCRDSNARANDGVLVKLATLGIARAHRVDMCAG